MNPLPYEPKTKYYGDEWLEFHDFLDTISDREGIFLELSLGLQLINPRELAYKTGQKEEMLKRIKCLISMNREPDQLKHEKILNKFGFTTMPINQKEDIQPSTGIM